METINDEFLDLSEETKNNIIQDIKELFSKIQLNPNIIFGLNDVIVKYINTYQKQFYVKFDISKYLTGNVNYDSLVSQFVEYLHYDKNLEICEPYIYNLYKYYGLNLDVDFTNYEKHIFTFILHNNNFITSIPNEVENFINDIIELYNKTGNIKGVPFMIRCSHYFINPGENLDIDDIEDDDYNDEKMVYVSSNKLHKYYDSIGYIKKILMIIYKYFIPVKNEALNVSIQIVENGIDYLKVIYL